ncbi:MAG: succinate dehydrogenase cytochrome b subunit [Dysgonamonadaceae bacterium]|jgi:succinate dehydrogenase / fumarate reductase cytochrome b subunit|nr:succinate dehydrogenase cytochrome b subunit [Dysgonamonadaceae bacterium]
MKPTQLSSITKKLIMSISGLFLILFLTLHAAINLVAVLSLEAYDKACEFMETNPIVQVMVPVLAVGFAVHIAFAFVLTWQNRKARGTEKYGVGNKTKMSWALQNMLVLGLVVLGFLAVHLSQFWAKMQLREWTGLEVVKGSELVVEVLSNPINAIMYIVWILALTLHLTHGFWSSFQSVGLNNSKWTIRLKIISHSYATLIAASFLTTIIYFYIKSL